MPMQVEPTGLAAWRRERLDEVLPRAEWVLWEAVYHRHLTRQQVAELLARHGGLDAEWTAYFAGVARDERPPRPRPSWHRALLDNPGADPHEVWRAYQATKGAASWNPAYFEDGHRFWVAERAAEGLAAVGAFGIAREFAANHLAWAFEHLTADAMRAAVDAVRDGWVVCPACAGTGFVRGHRFEFDCETCGLQGQVRATPAAAAAK